MVIRLDAELTTALTNSAQHEGMSAESLAVDTLRARFLKAPIIPQDDWERTLLGAAINHGRSLPAAALTSHGLYE